MATLATQTLTDAGLAPTYNTCAGGGDKVVPGPNAWIHIKNASGAPITVTVDDVNSTAPVGATTFNADVVVSVPAGGERLIGPLVPSRFANSVDGLCSVTYSGVTSLTMASISL